MTALFPSIEANVSPFYLAWFLLVFAVSIVMENVSPDDLGAKLNVHVARDDNHFALSKWRMKFLFYLFYVFPVFTDRDEKGICMSSASLSARYIYH